MSWLPSWAQVPACPPRRTVRDDLAEIRSLSRAQLVARVQELAREKAALTRELRRLREMQARIPGELGRVQEQLGTATAALGERLLEGRA
jgi:hypothetical protein